MNTFMVKYMCENEIKYTRYIFYNMISKSIFVLSSKQFVKNIKLPICYECLYYVPGKTRSGGCSKFGEKDLITGKITYANAIHTRFDENICGKKGNYFEKK